MINLSPLQTSDFDSLVCNEKMAYLQSYITDEDKKALCAQKYGYSARNGEGRVVFLGGVIEHWPGRGEAWAVFDRDCKKEFFSLFLAIRRLLKVCPTKRIEAVVDYDFGEGHRLAIALGFEVETFRMRNYRQNGKDATMYVRIGGDL